MNIMNALFMVAAALVAMVLLGMGLSIPQIFLVTALMNAVVAIYIFLAGAGIPDALLGLDADPHAAPGETVDADRIPEDGPAVLVCNHVSYVDALVIAAASPRPIRFVMDHRIFEHPGDFLAVPRGQGDPDRAGQGRSEADGSRPTTRSPRRWKRAIWSASSRKASSPAMARSTRSGAASSTSSPARRCR